ncbi:CaiB/BaiF CoA transferase family protein [Solicola sp. PLA-1-18]|uniref:CaiB/BaiF CoA transferase family protein n=1 Tax=Solicola sp. PLA-1-18 TaxID=3380532 RepID=UPI003B7993C8
MEHIESTTPTGPGGPLAGIRVIEVGVFMAAPFATMQLADLGADVVKVETPGTGDPTRATGPFVDGEGSAFLRLNRNKRSVALDLKQPEGLEAFLALVDTADVLVENLRPGAMRRLGLGPDELRGRNPRLVYASASGWGQDGPLSALPGLDIMAQARSGLMSITGHADSGPAKVGVPVCDLVAGLYVALGAVAALRRRDTTGVGDYLDVSLMETGVSLAVWEAGRFFATGEVGTPQGTAHQSQAPYQAVPTSDGWVTVGAITPPTWKGFCAAIDRPDLHDDPAYASVADRRLLRDALMEQIERTTRTRTTDDLVEAWTRHGVPCAPLSTFDQVFDDPHLRARDFFWDAPDAAGAPVRQIGSPLRFTDAATSRRSAGPSLGQDTRDVLDELLGPERAEAVIASGAAG